jgi:hypothetical protein
MAHYFAPFQAFIIEEAERERGKFDLRVALEILRREAEYRSQAATPQGSFLYQFECLCRNRLRYDPGLQAMAADPIYDEAWREWIDSVRRRIGMVEIGDLIFIRSEHYRVAHRLDRIEQRSEDDEVHAEDGSMNAEAEADPHGVYAASMEDDGRIEAPVTPLFGDREGRIALANRRKDPLVLFAALHRQLGYPSVPRPAPLDNREDLLGSVARRVERMEKRIKLLEEEQKGGIDLTKFFGPPKEGDAP